MLWGKITVQNHTKKKKKKQNKLDVTRVLSVVTKPVCHSTPYEYAIHDALTHKKRIEIPGEDRDGDGGVNQLGRKSRPLGILRKVRVTEGSWSHCMENQYEGRLC